jgi:hypothetical protein
MKSIQKMGGSYKHLSIFLATMMLLALFMSVAPVLAFPDTSGPIHNGPIPGPNSLCRDTCSGTLGPIAIGSPITEDRFIRVMQIVNHRLIFILVHQQRTVQYYMTYQMCTPMADCGNTGCAASGSPYEKVLSITKTQTIPWHNV